MWAKRMGGRANPADCREGHNLVDIKATNAKHQGFAYYETAFVAGRDQVGELSLIAMISAPCALRYALCAMRLALTQLKLQTMSRLQSQRTNRWP